MSAFPLLSTYRSRARCRNRRDLYVDRSGKAEVKDLTDDVGRLSEKFKIREPPGQLIAERLQVTGGWMMRLLEGDQDLAIGRSDCDTVAQCQVGGVRHVDVFVDQVEFVGRNHLADVVLEDRKSTRLNSSH